MKTLGFLGLLTLMILVTTMDSSIASQIPLRVRDTSEESTSCRREKEEQREESQVSQTGNDTTS